MNPLTLIHFNDVYHMERAPRFSTEFRKAQLDNSDAITIFSGDAYSPSKESAMVQGKHMVPILNHLGIQVAVLGNHDFDFGLEVLESLVDQSEFPWLMSNFKMGPLRDSNPSHSKDWHIIERNGKKIAFIGLAGKEHADVRLLLSEDIHLVDPVECCLKLCAFLKSEHSVDVIIALTHMRIPEEMNLLKCCPDIDLYLGGHDHDYHLIGDYDSKDSVYSGKIRLVKSGSDFEQFSVIQFHSRDRVVVTRHDISPDTVQDQTLVDIIAPMNEHIGLLLKKRILHTNVELDGRAIALRQSETNLGNLIADTFKAYLDVDFAIVNAGAIRCDRVVPVGDLALTDVIDIMPFQNPFYVKQASGKVIKEALENGLSDQKFDGRFLQVSGIRLVVSKSAECGCRIQSMTDASGVEIDLTKIYTFAVSSFITFGGDGFSMMKGLESIPPDSEGISETEIMLAVFSDIDNQENKNAMRARGAVIKGVEDGLPSVAPQIDGRITFID